MKSWHKSGTLNLEKVSSKVLIIFPSVLWTEIINIH